MITGQLVSGHKEIKTSHHLQQYSRHKHRLIVSGIMEASMCHTWVLALVLLVKSCLIPSVFAQLELEYHLDEEVQSGTFVADIYRDARLSSLYDEAAQSVIYLRFLQDGISNFTITNRTGIVRTQGRLDREAICANKAPCTMRLDVAIQPVQYLKIIKVTLEIQDKNDNPPRFIQPVITHSLLESAIPGSGFVIPQPQDPDSPEYSIMRYELQPRNSPFRLSITNKVDGSQEIQLVLNTSLDREQEELYTLQVIAYDGGSPPNYGSVELQINILDANDNHPAFNKPTYEVSIPENIARFSTISQVLATDQDSGDNGEIIYSFSESTASNYGHVFGINNQTGDVYIKGNIDYEVASIYHLSVVAQDKGPDSIPGDATVVIHVTDINDHAPDISINTLSPSSDGTAEVSEGSPISTFVAHITVSDQDSGANAEFNCTLDDHHFALHYLYDGEFQIVTATYLDREDKEMYSVALTCTDHGGDQQVSMETIKVRVKDVNDHAPVFSQSSYDGEVIENNYQGAFVARVNATDPDLGENSRITYTLPADMQRYFGIESDTGIIRAQKPLDREVIDQMRFYVTATDHGDPRRSSSALVIVDIQDVNDKPPVFPSLEYTFAVFENEHPGTQVGQVTAEDMDSALYNTITYSFLPNHNSDAFRINPSTGQISTNQNLDREHKPVYYLEVLAQDKGSNPLSGSASVTVYVTDRNDNAPTFDYPSDFNNTIYLSTQVPQGYVVTKVTAHDIDIGNNAKVSYEIQDSKPDDTFEIDPIHGTLIVRKSLAHITNQNYRLTVIAKDEGEPQNMAFSNLNLVVNKSVPFPLPEAHTGLLIGQNFTIVISVACVSALVIVVLVTAIVCLKCQDATRQARKYNCRMEAQRGVDKDAENPKTGSAESPWIKDHHTKSNGTAGRPTVDNMKTVISDIHQDHQKFTSLPCDSQDDLTKALQQKHNKDISQKVWPTIRDPGNMNIQTLPPQEHYHHVNPSPMVRGHPNLSSFNPNTPLDVISHTTVQMIHRGTPIPNTGPSYSLTSYPPSNDQTEPNPASVDRWRHNINNRRDLQVHQVLDTLKGGGDETQNGYSAQDTASVGSSQSSNTDSGCIPSEEGEVPAGRHSHQQWQPHSRAASRGPGAYLQLNTAPPTSESSTDSQHHWRGIFT